MNDDIPIVDGEELSKDQRQLLALFDELESGQIELLDQAGKRIVELCTALLGTLFVVTAFGEDFPPAYIMDNDLARWLAIATLALYILAMLTAFLVLQPRKYRRYTHNLTEMRNQFEVILAHKVRWFNWAAVLFVLGSLALAALVGSILFFV